MAEGVEREGFVGAIELSCDPQCSHTWKDLIAQTYKSANVAQPTAALLLLHSSHTAHDICQSIQLIVLGTDTR